VSNTIPTITDTTDAHLLAWLVQSLDLKVEVSPSAYGSGADVSLASYPCICAASLSETWCRELHARAVSVLDDSEVGQRLHGSLHILRSVHGAAIRAAADPRAIAVLSAVMGAVESRCYGWDRIPRGVDSTGGDWMDERG
jgi:hypothetical protein